MRLSERFLAAKPSPGSPERCEEMVWTEGCTGSPACVFLELTVPSAKGRYRTAVPLSMMTSGDGGRIRHCGQRGARAWRAVCLPLQAVHAPVETPENPWRANRLVSASASICTPGDRASWRSTHRPCRQPPATYQMPMAAPHTPTRAVLLAALARPPLTTRARPQLNNPIEGLHISTPLPSALSFSHLHLSHRTKAIDRPFTRLTTKSREPLGPSAKCISGSRAAP